MRRWTPHYLLAGQFLDEGPFVEASAELKTRYDLYDLVLAKTICCGDFRARPYIGARFLQLRQNYRATLTPLVSSEEDLAAVRQTQWRTDLPAGGLTLGIGGRYQVCGAWNLTGRLGASVLGGRVKHHNQWFVPDEDDIEVSRTEKRHHCSVITGWDAAIGLAYDWCCCGNPVGLSIGYEIQDWWNMPQRPRFVLQQIGNTQVTPDDGARFTVHGLFVRLGIAF